MKEGIKEALARLNAERAKSSPAAQPKGQPTESGEVETGTVRIGDEVKHLREHSSD